MNNFEHIKNLNKQELAHYLFTQHATCSWCAFNDNSKMCNGSSTCEDGISAWLEAPYKEQDSWENYLRILMRRIL